jgi:hypothetical protein
MAMKRGDDFAGTVQNGRPRHGRCQGPPICAPRCIGRPHPDTMATINRSRCVIAYRQDARSGAAPSHSLSVACPATPRLRAEKMSNNPVEQTIADITAAKKQLVMDLRDRVPDLFTGDEDQRRIEKIISTLTDEETKLRWNRLQISLEEARKQLIPRPED